MCPGFIVENSSSVGFAYAKFTAYMAVWFCAFQRTHSQNYFLGKFSRGGFFTVQASPSLFGVLRVFFGRALAQMVRINADWIIARMQNLKIGPFICRKIKRQLMGAVESSGFISCSDAYFSVSIGGNIAGPNPAIAVGSKASYFRNLKPEVLSLVVRNLWKVYSWLRHDLVSFMRKIVSRPVASVEALARVAVYYSTEKAVQS